MNSPGQARCSFPLIRQRAAKIVLALAAMLMLAILMTPFAQAQTYTYTLLYSFPKMSKGWLPTGPLVEDAGGNLYGITTRGGIRDFGTVFKLSPAGKLTPYRFPGGTGGGLPDSGLIRDADGNLYGTTFRGGDLTCKIGGGCGTVFKLDAKGEATVLHAFHGADGSFPVGRLIRDVSGNLYGTTAYGGDPTCVPGGCGTVFKLDSSGGLTVLHAFDFPSGGYPQSRLIPDVLGNLYGNTNVGGTYNSGGIFRLDATGTYQLLYSFNGQSEGGRPIGDIARDAAGNLFGVNSYGSGAQQYGTVYKLDSRGRLTVLHSFTSGSDGASPNGGVILDEAGNLYGTTFVGGDGHGVVFRLDTATGDFTVIHTFEGPDGILPSGSLSRDGSGNLYGTTRLGGAYNLGAAFKLAPN